MSDQIRELLHQLDPMHPGVPVEPATTSSSRQRLEHIMSTPIADTRTPTRPGWQRPAIAVAFVAVLALVAGIVGALDQGETDVALELTLPDGGVMASCLPVTPERLSEMALAFEGTVSEQSGDVVTLTVDRWYRGGDARQVELHAITDMDIMISPIDFRMGEGYLITATDGWVNYCGYSAVATPELRSMFEEAYRS